MLEHTHYKLYAVGAVVRMCGMAWKFGSLSTPDPEFPGEVNSAIKEMAVDHRKCLEQIEAALLELLSNAVGPIWLDLPEEIREICRKAGMEG